MPSGKRMLVDGFRIHFGLKMHNKNGRISVQGKSKVSIMRWVCILALHCNIDGGKMRACGGRWYSICNAFPHETLPSFNECKTNLINFI